MIKKILLAIIIVVCLFWINVYAKKIVVIYTYDLIKIDGLMTDWENIKLYKNNGGKIEYAFKMDNENIYILFKFNDQKLLSTFFSDGMKIWLNKIDNNKHIYGINFIKKTITSDQMIQLMEKKYGKIPKDKKDQIYTKKSYDIYQNIIINEEDKQVVPVKFNEKASCSFKINVTKDKRVVIEYKIPHILQKQLLSIGELNEEIRLDFEWSGMTKEMYKQRLKTRSAMA